MNGSNIDPEGIGIRIFLAVKDPDPCINEFHVQVAEGKDGPEEADGQRQHNHRHGQGNNRVGQWTWTRQRRR